MICEVWIIASHESNCRSEQARAAVWRRSLWDGGDTAIRYDLPPVPRRSSMSCMADVCRVHGLGEVNHASLGGCCPQCFCLAVVSRCQLAGMLIVCNGNLQNW